MSKHARPQVLGYESDFVQSGDFEGTKLAWLNPKTLRPLPGRQLRLGDYTGDGELGPDRKTLGIGGPN